MLSLDMVFYITSASSPLGKEEVDAMKAMAPFKRQVVVNGMHLVDEANRERVLNYIANINTSLGLSSVIVLKAGKILVSLFGISYRLSVSCKHSGIENADSSSKTCWTRLKRLRAMKLLIWRVRRVNRKQFS